MERKAEVVLTKGMRDGAEQFIHGKHVGYQCTDFTTGITIVILHPDDVPPSKEEQFKIVMQLMHVIEVISNLEPNTPEAMASNN